MALEPPWLICASCRGITRRLWLHFSEFEASAAKGCHSCTILYEAVREPFKSRLEIEPVFLERATEDQNNKHPLALTIDIAPSADSSTWDESLWNGNNSQQANFRHVAIADVKYVTDSKDVPHGARLFKGKAIHQTASSGR